MNSFVRDSIEYGGIDLFYEDDGLVNTTKNFKQNNIDLISCIPYKKPHIENIIRVDIDKEIVKTKIIKTLKGESLEGQKGTGYNVLVMCDLILKIIYVADKKDKSVHAFNTIIPFSEYVVMNEKFNPFSLVTANIYIEDVYVEKRNKNHIYSNTTILTVVQSCL